MEHRIKLADLYAAPGFLDLADGVAPSFDEARAAALYSFLPEKTTFTVAADELVIARQQIGSKRQEEVIFACALMIESPSSMLTNSVVERIAGKCVSTSALTSRRRDSSVGAALQAWSNVAAVHFAPSEPQPPPPPAPGFAVFNFAKNFSSPTSDRS